MPKNNKPTTTLIIVESPAKCKKIEEYLGPGYKCIATYGHLRTIQSLKDIDINNQFTPTYSLIDDPIKRKQIDFLRREIKLADEVILSSDKDREGEMISYSLIELFQLPLTTKRITFNEITESALRHAIQHPRTVDMHLVHAQQARSILDLLVGFKVSPMLWKLMTNPKGKKDRALSAGRCQTPALKLVYDNQRDIDETTASTVYQVTGYFTNLHLPFDLIMSEQPLVTEEDVVEFLETSADFSHVFSVSDPVKVCKPPPEPFTTSRLQQVASNELHCSPKDTMRICQSLYESGFITYMRTDSKVYSDEFWQEAVSFISATYGPVFTQNPTTTQTEENEKRKGKGKGKKKQAVFSQDAHEAIRPTNISLCQLPEELDPKQKRMYKLIWRNTLESCMATASFFSLTASVTSPIQTGNYVFRCEQVDFAGWKILDTKLSRENPEFVYLQTIKKDSVLPFKKIAAKVGMKGHKAHLSEARLVHLLEEKGIGRPSTFSSLIDKIQDRGYVKKQDIEGNTLTCKDFELNDQREIVEIETIKTFGQEKGKLVIQPLGVLVMEFLQQHFHSLFNYEFTSAMEASLDQIAKGELSWTNVCAACNAQVNALLEEMKDEKKMEIKLDDDHSVVIGKYGPVVKHVDKDTHQVTFKSLKEEVDLSQVTINDVVQEENNNAPLGQWEGQDVFVKKGKFGLYAKWGTQTVSLKSLGKDNVSLDEVVPLLMSKTTKNANQNMIRELSAHTSIRSGPKGEYIFHKTATMKRPQFFDIKAFVKETNEDFKTCNLALVKSWLKEKYQLRI